MNGFRCEVADAGLAMGEVGVSHPGIAFVPTARAQEATERELNLGLVELTIAAVN